MASQLAMVHYKMFIYVLTLAGCFAILLVCGHLFVNGSVGIAEKTHIPKILIGTLLVSIGTTLPELAVSVQSAILGHTNLALGNAIGSVVADDSLAFGAAAVLAPLPFVVNRKLLKPSAFLLLGSTVLLYIFAFNGTITRLEGAVFLSVLAGYFGWLIHSAKSHREKALQEQTPGLEPPRIAPTGTALAVKFTAGLTGVLIASRGIIWAATGISKEFGISEIIIGLTVVAIGTSLPEIATCAIAARKKEGDIAAGNILGADILNILWIIGMSAVAHPLNASRHTIHFYCLTMLAIVVTFLSILLFVNKIKKIHGGILLTFYLAFLSVSIFLFVI